MFTMPFDTSPMASASRAPPFGGPLRVPVGGLNNLAGLLRVDFGHHGGGLNLILLGGLGLSGGLGSGLLRGQAQRQLAPFAAAHARALNASGQRVGHFSFHVVQIAHVRSSFIVIHRGGRGPARFPSMGAPASAGVSRSSASPGLRRSVGLRQLLVVVPVLRGVGSLVLVDAHHEQAQELLEAADPLLPVVLVIAVVPVAFVEVAVIVEVAVLRRVPRLKGRGCRAAGASSRTSSTGASAGRSPGFAASGAARPAARPALSGARPSAAPPAGRRRPGARPRPAALRRNPRPHRGGQTDWPACRVCP